MLNLPPEPKTIEQFLSSRTDFYSLSFQDLMEARDLFHAHLINKRNVVATALGRFRVRHDDPWPEWARPRDNPEGTAAVAEEPSSAASNATPKSESRPKPKGPKRLSESEVRSYSWPAILVFVSEWAKDEEFATEDGPLKPSDRVPEAVYLPDGRKVPICVLLAPPDETDDLERISPMFPEDIIGGGYPVISDVQGEEHFASVACLVTDGHLIYALTNRHVAGAAGEIIYSMLAGEKVRVGRSARKQETRLPFERVYPGWPGKNVYVNLDVGLIEVDDRKQWTAQVYSLGELGELADLNQGNISLRLIGCPVRAFGAASREMQGEVCALFYRYKSIGGFEYVSDLLIGPRPGEPFSTQPGDSGTLWVLDVDAEAPMPLALQWGGNRFSDQARDRGQAYALATCLSTICNLLDVDLVRDWNAGLPYYWGALGHYSIAALACEKVQGPKLRQLMMLNEPRISYPPDVLAKIKQGSLPKTPGFVPLANVPDMVWKPPRGTPPPYVRREENPNHFANMDRQRPDGKTLLQLCRESNDNITVQVWRDYYQAIHDSKPGLLPFRVWQIYDAMVNFVRQGDVVGYVAAAGVLAHYIGDACQPLHISYLYDGDPDDKIPGPDLDSQGNPKLHPRGAGVHSAYETMMVNRRVNSIIPSVRHEVESADSLKACRTGREAAVRTVELMQATFDAIGPLELVDCYADVASKPGDQTVPVTNELWSRFGGKTIEVMTRGCLYLAMLWESAWQEGNGDVNISPAQIRREPQQILSKRYLAKTFLTSHTLSTIAGALTEH